MGSALDDLEFSNDDGVSTEHQEDAVWEGGPSQILNLGNYLACVVVAVIFVVLSFTLTPFLAIGVVLPLGYAGWKFLVVRCNAPR